MNRIFYMLLFLAMQIPLLAAAQCKNNCISASDLEQMMRVTQSLEAWKENLRDPKGSKRMVLRRWLNASGETYEDLRTARAATSQLVLRGLYGRLASSFSEARDLLAAGDALLDAEAQNTTRLATGIAESLVSKDAKRLVAPIVSAAELQYRLSSFHELFDNRLTTLENELRYAFQKAEQDLPCLRGC